MENMLLNVTLSSPSRSFSKTRSVHLHNSVYCIAKYCIQLEDLGKPRVTNQAVIFFLENDRKTI